MVISLFWGSSIRERTKVKLKHTLQSRREQIESQQLLRVQSFALRDEAGKKPHLVCFLSRRECLILFPNTIGCFDPLVNTFKSQYLMLYNFADFVSEGERGGKSPFNISPRLKRKKHIFCSKRKEVADAILMGNKKKNVKIPIFKHKNSFNWNEIFGILRNHT